MKTFLKPFYFTLLLLTVISCEDILEEDITNDIINPISPTEGTVVESNIVNFQWNILDGADNYRVQLFDNNGVIVLDSVVSQTNLTHPVSSGDYKWRVRGENFGYQSTYSLPVSFSVIESTNLTTQQVILSSPSNSFYTNTNSINLAWQDLAPADTYNIEIINVTNGSSIVYQQSGIANTVLNLSNMVFSTDGEYIWKVKAVNTTSATPFSSRTIFIDRTAPNQPQLGLPANNSTQLINQALTFNWTTAADSGTIQSALSYVIEFSNSNTFATLTQSSNASTNSLQQTFTAVGDHYWRVKTLDAAGNVSSYSTIFKFTIN
jgi:hypothetical protein